MSYLAKSEIDIAATPSDVWRALTEPDTIAKYFFGSRVHTEWQVGSPIVWKGEFNGKPYEDKGEIVEFEPNRLLRVTHFSPSAGRPDEPENYHTLTYRLDDRRGTTHVSLTQDNNASEEEAERATANWATMLKGLKSTVESE